MRPGSAGSEIAAVLEQFPDDYQEKRLQGWAANARFWATYLDATPSRRELLEEQALRAARLCAKLPAARVVDCGSGEGMFLRLLQSTLGDGAEFCGVDFCDGMIALARRRSRGQSMIRFEKCDLEDSQSSLLGPFDLAVGSLVLDEVRDLRQALRSISSMVVPGGHVLLTVLDEEAERRKLLRFVHSEASSDVGDTARATLLLVMKHFRVGAHVSPQPYCRVIRSAASYIAAASEVGLTCLGEDGWSSPRGTTDGTSYRFLTFVRSVAHAD